MHIAPLKTHAEALYDSDSRRISERLPAITILKTPKPSGFEATLYTPVICLILQGAKHVVVGDHSVTASAGEAIVVSHALPVSSSIVAASEEAPYVALVLSLDLDILRSFHDVAPPAPEAQNACALRSDAASQSLLDAFCRYLELSHSAQDAAVLGHAYLRELHYRALKSPLGASLRALTTSSTHASRIARAVNRIRQDYASPISVADLAEVSGMAVSSFHGHFKAITGTTPLQYLKATRLIAARDRLRTGGSSVSAVSYDVGYESPTHFARDYARQFGHPPSAESAMWQQPAQSVRTRLGAA